MINGHGRHGRPSGATVGVVVALAAMQPVAGLAQELEEIVVTARRVEERIKEVPLAITAFDSSAIESAAINNLNDVAALTPGLSFFNPFGENLPVPVIRGVVPQDIFGENSAAIFVDGVFVSGREGLNFSQLDVERIEVLKGPQSAMYGRNAFSGAINYITKPPGDEFEYRAEVEAGSSGKQRVLGAIGGPLPFIEGLSGRFSALYDEWDGSYRNTLAPENDIGGYRFRSLQGKLRWQPRDNLDINIGLYSSNDEIDEAVMAGLPANCEDQVEQTSKDQREGPLPRLQDYCGKFPKLEHLPDALFRSAYPDMVVNPDSVTRDGMPKLGVALGEDRDLIRGNLNIAWDLDFGTFTFLTGYSDTEQDSLSDFGRSLGDSIPLVYCPTATTVGGLPTCLPPFDWARAPMGFYDDEDGTTTEEWSQEIRFTSPAGERLRYSLGFYFYNVDRRDYFGELVAATELPVSIFDVGIGPVAYPTALAIGSYIFGPSLMGGGPLDALQRPEAQRKTEAWSVFSSADYALTDALELRAELRFSTEEQDHYAYDYTRCGDNVDVYPFNDPPVDECGDDYYDLRVLPPSRIDSGSTRFNTVTGRLGLKYLFESGWMAYGSIARGEKPGGLQLVRVDLAESTGLGSELLIIPFDPETLLAYEVGLKGYTSDRRLSVDVSTFYNDWGDIVLRQLTDVSPTSGLRLDQPIGLNYNAGDARVWGWEVQADIAFTENLTGRTTLAYTDSQLTDARLDTISLYPSFYTSEPSCAPAAIQAIPDASPDTDDNEAQMSKATQCRNLSGDVSGNTQMRQPEWTASASLTYRRALAGEWEWFTRADASYLGKIFAGNDNQSWLPARSNVNWRIGVDSPTWSVEFWVRNLLENRQPTAAYRDIFWTNDSDMQGRENPPTIRETSTFDDFPPFRLAVSYPSLREYGLVAKYRFGGAVRPAR
ncbi:MAG: TonB-dependent receptor [Gammaproteobacteria bacterium]|nr:TonB-dependent receptor [Gammaproteobacteria bacterium]